MLLEVSRPSGGFLVRRPLLDGDCRVVGYELGLRDRLPVPVLPGAESAEQARDEYLIASVVDLDYQRALGNRLTLLNLAPASLQNPMLAELPADKVALSLPAELPDNGGLGERLTGLGLRPVFDDAGEEPAATLPAGCSWARLDCSGLDAMGMGRWVDSMRSQGAQRLIAGNVDSEETFDVCRKLGFDWFHGDFLARPRVGRGQGRRLDGNVMQVMILLNQAMARVPIDQLEEGFKRNAALSYRLLRYINSPANGLDRSMHSIGQAIMWLGYGPLYRWLSLLLFASERSDGRGNALLRNALVRARLMENLAADKLAREQRGGLFIVGILSQLDAALEMPMALAIEPLRLPADMIEALLHGGGPYSPYLRLAQACEHFDQEMVEQLAQAHGLSADEVNVAHVNALIWSETLDS